VLIHDDTPRIKWKLAVITDLVKGNDGHVRAASVRPTDPLPGYTLLKSGRISPQRPKQKKRTKKFSNEEVAEQPQRTPQEK
jgi:hypothetical protein